VCTCAHAEAASWQGQATGMAAIKFRPSGSRSARSCISLSLRWRQRRPRRPPLS
jgi:hypothetical protein